MAEKTDTENSEKGLTVAVATLGCKVNQCESAAIAEMLAARGITIVPFDEKADFFIVNTCTVTGRTDYQSRQLISRAIRKNPRATILVTGCYAQRAPGELSSLPGVKFVLGNTEKELIPDIILKAVRDGSISRKDETRIIVGEIRREKTFPLLGESVFPEHTRAFLKIQDGCDAFCSYCVIPYTRGTSRSLAPAETLQRVGSLTTKGCKEIVLTGIHLGLWGRELDPPADLSALLRKIVEKRLVERLRISSLEPHELTAEMISLLREGNIICPHLHLSLQSGCDRILTMMRRNYNTAFFRDMVLKIHGSIPGLAVGIDVIAGFPGETEAEFRQTLEMIESLPVAYLHVFPFSCRPGTAAAKMSGQVPENEKKRRVQLLRETGTAKRRGFAKGFIGKPLTVLIEGRTDKNTGLPVGFSENYIPVAVRGTGVTVNSIVSVIPEAVNGEGLIADRITPVPAGGEG